LNVQLRYGLDERPPAGELALFGVQWFAVTIPVIIIIGKVAAGLHAHSAAEEIAYIQKLSFVMAAALMLELAAGHRLPLIIGPSTVLLIGIIASRDFGAASIYSSIVLGGVLLAVLSVTGLFAHLKKFFTTRVVAVVLLLIAFTMTPTIMGLITSPRSGSGPLANVIFSLAMVFTMFYLYSALKNIWRSTLIIWAMLAGSAMYFGLFPSSILFDFRDFPLAGSFLHDFTMPLSLDAGVTISFLFCYLALAVNDLGSIQSLNEMLKPEGEQRRITRGMLVTGLANVAAGMLGVIGPVNFSLSPGVIMSTRCASRAALVPTALLLALLSFSPALLCLLGNVPPVVIGCILVYILCAQIVAGLAIITEKGGAVSFETGLVIGLPLILGTVIAFLPAGVLAAFPATLRPVLGNGFVVGVLAALIMEHLVFRGR
jgi:xanthine/uracil permease